MENDAVVIGQGTAELKKNIHQLNKDIKHIQRGIKPLSLPIIGGRK